MAEIPSRIVRKVYTSKTREWADGKERRVTVVECAGRRAAEIRDVVFVPDSVGGPEREVYSSGSIVPLSEVISLRKTLQQIEADFNLVDEESA